MKKFIHDGETIISGDGTFKLAFFSPPHSTDRYVGIWYNKVSEMNVVWVANRNNPLNDSSGLFKITEDGDLKVLNGQKEILWQSNVTYRATNLSKAQLLDSGNLVLLSSNSTILWQSFDHPTNTMFPKMSTTFNKENYKNPLLQSWRSPSNPSEGRFSLRLDSVILPEFIIGNNDRPYWRSGPWNGNMFIGIQVNYPDFHSHGLSVQNDDQGTITVVYSNPENSLSNIELDYQGNLIQQYWDDTNGKWKVWWQAP
uniref:Bulb-type lectin domain-containing protein n=1 Tax=Chenopodium quinoa TaxID=63459 RepID=A0A803LL21_CHEQI